ncbi:MAG: RidA family protein [Candidatus Latescibacteria bacterium]|nr:RidA family protein [Candidatus Latescibacterota bacterium]
MSAADRLAALGLTLPAPPQPAGAYTRAVQAGDLIFLSGQLPMETGQIKYAGTVGDQLSEEEGYAAARLCALNALSILQAELGSLEQIGRIVRLGGFVCCAPGFSGQAGVLNGASELVHAVFQERGVHARFAVGSPGLPLNAAVELEVIAQAS